MLERLLRLPVSQKLFSTSLAFLLMVQLSLVSVNAESATYKIYENLRYLETANAWVLDGVADNGVTTAHIPAEIDGKPVLASGTHFRDCPALTEIMVDAAQQTLSTADGVLFSKDGSILLEYPCAKDGAYTLPETVSLIGEDAFANADKLTELTLTDTLTNVGARAFTNCTALTEIHGAVPFTYGTVFTGCTSLKSLTLAEFGDASGSVRLTQFSLIDCAALETVTIPACRVLASDVTIAQCPKLRSVVFPELEDVSGTSYFTIAGCDALTKLELPTIATKMEGAFYTISDCPNLTTVTFKEGYLAGAAIENCPALTKALYLTGVHNRNESNFTGCGKLNVYGMSADIQIQNDCTRQNIPFVALDKLTGDLNTDAEVNLLDAILLAKMLGQDSAVSVSTIGIGNADINRDGDLTAQDLTNLLRILANIA